MHSTTARISGLVIGLFIIVFGLSLLMDGNGLDQSARTKALIYALTALGIGVTAAALLPNTLTISGEKIQPLGANVQATGGAAFFVATLIFLFYTEDKAPVSAAEPQAAETVAVDPQSEAALDVAPADDAPADDAPAEQAALAPPQQPAPTQPAPQNLVALQPGFIANPYGPAPANPNRITRVRTYCSDCCPGGPMPCGQVGGAQSFDVAEAQIGAVAMCIDNGGSEMPCMANLEQF